MGLTNKNIDLTPIWDKAPRGKKQSEKIVSKVKPVKDLTPIWDAPPKRQCKPKIKKLKPNQQPTLFDIYQENVRELTEQNKHLIEGIEKRGWRNFHIDHKLSICWGFYNNIPPENIAHIDNLRMIWWKENMDKRIGCFVDDKNKWICENLTIYPLGQKNVKAIQ